MVNVAWRLRTGLAVLLVIGLAAASLRAFPEPSIVPESWELQFSQRTPRTIGVREADGSRRWYWYMPYKVVNQTDEEQLFVPEVTVATDQGDIVTAGRGVSAAAFFAVSQQLNNPLLENPMQVAGRMLVGEDQARESVAIWPAFGHDVDEMRLFFAGLSGETQVVRNPVTDAEVSLRKTLMLVFATPGTGVHPMRQPIQQASRGWVMR